MSNNELPPLPKPSSVISDVLEDSTTSSVSSMNTTHSTYGPVITDPADFPPGLLYVEDFLSPEEQERCLASIDAHAFAQKIHRRQQFYGQIYYHTPQSPRSTLQPVNEELATKIMGLNMEEQEEIKKEDVVNNDVVCHSMDSLQWVLDKLIDQGLFFRADDTDPMIECVADEHMRLQKIERKAGPGKNMKWTTPDGKAVLLPTFPDQVLVNEYTIKQNIGTHYDDALAFGPLIVGVSLGEECTMVLSMPLCMGKADAELRTKAMINDIEDIIPDSTTGNTEKIPDLEFPITGPRDELLSYLLSIRNFSDDGWNESSGPGLLAKYCKCTREEYILQQHPEKQHFLTTGSEISVGNKVKQMRQDKRKIIEELVKYHKHCEEHNIAPTFPKHQIEEEAAKRVAEKYAKTLTSEEATRLIDEYLFSYEYPPNTDLVPKLPHVNKCPHHYKSVQIKLKPGSVYILSGSTRYMYRHGIRKFTRGEQLQNPDYRRVSMTFRSLLPGRRQVAKGSEVDHADHEYKYTKTQNKQNNITSNNTNTEMETHTQ